MRKRKTGSTTRTNANGSIIVLFSLIYILPSLLWQALNGVLDSEFPIQSFGSIVSLLNNGYSTLLQSIFIFFGVIFIPVLGSACSILLTLGFDSIFNWYSTTILNWLHTIIFAAFNLSFGALFIPYWQSLKPVAYYQLNLDTENS